MGKVLIACEESQRVCSAFRERGHEAYSCDILECSGGHPEWHILGDVLPILGGGCQITTMDGAVHDIPGRWDLIIAHPPCTYLSNCCTRGFSLKSTPADKVVNRWEQRAIAAVFFMRFIGADCKRIAVENPIGFMTRAYRKPDQYVSPWWFSQNVGDENYHEKRTGLWLKNLPTLEPNGVFEKFDCAFYGQYPTGKNKTWEDSIKGKDRAKVRSKTFPGIAQAMADQWGPLIEKED